MVLNAEKLLRNVSSNMASHAASALTVINLMRSSIAEQK
jgi:hypothetical protein